MRTILLSIYLLVFGLFISGCLKIDPADEISIKNDDFTLAFPLFHSTLNVSELAAATGDESSLEVSDGDEITLIYRGPVVEGNSFQVFPPAVGLIDIEISDTVFRYEVPLEYWEDIHLIRMGNTLLEFSFVDRDPESFNITLEIPELSKNGMAFREEYTMSEGSLDSPPISLEGFEVRPENRGITIRYTAIDSRGNRRKLDDVAFRFDVFRAVYIEGIFAPRTIDVQGDAIDVGILENWRAGGVEFENPELYLRVENSFGLQAFSRTNEIKVITTEGNAFPLESPLLEEGIDFAYPRLDEVGEVKITEITFDETNSNLNEIFSGKTARITYDIDALVNNLDANQPGFVSENAYFRIEPIARLPLRIHLDDLVLAERTEVDFSALNDIEEAEIQWSISNDFPIEMEIQAFLYTGSEILDSVFSQRVKIPAAQVNNHHIIATGEWQVIESYNTARLDRLREANEVEVIAHFNTAQTGVQVQILDSYFLRIDAGMLAKLK